MRQLWRILYMTYTMRILGALKVRYKLKKNKRKITIKTCGLHEQNKGKIGYIFKKQKSYRSKVNGRVRLADVDFRVFKAIYSGYKANIFK